ncbi:MAG: zf-HC2 domain-containing protein [Candidatus Cloacimonetes bacterium]|nr:zf-HC2 domain-containing protein [Candidatus Cloacimonadota bacterium]
MGKMKCDNRNLIKYTDNELSSEDKAVVSMHISGCAACQNEMADIQSINDIFKSYQEIPASDVFLAGLKAIPLQCKKRYSIFHLYPRELALSAMMIFIALYIGIFFSFNTFTTSTPDSYTAFEYFEGVSLVSLLEN